MPNQEPLTSDPQKSNRRVVVLASMTAVGMLCLGMASKPLYDTFCRVTGYGGTTRLADAKSETMIERQISVRFDANTRSDLPWEFKPEQVSIDVKLGQNALAFYTAHNTSDEAIVGTASYNVSPIKAAPYFSKLECFCFTEQVLEPGEEVRMPVLFFVDPLMAEDKRLDEIKTITLSYTFHKVKEPGDDVYDADDRASVLKEIKSINLTQ
jgi:cytochrome c oxidase assembly protein subunit 11